MRRCATAALVIVALASAACGGEEEPTARVDPEYVRACLERSSARWSEIPLSDFGGVVFGIDFGTNSVQIYVEPGEAEVGKERESIRAAEDEVGNTAPGERVILVEGGNVLVSWANDPPGDQESLVRSCAGVA